MFRILFATFAVALAAATAQAQRADSLFDLRISGILVGDLRLSAVESPGAYSLAGAIQSRGAARVFRNFSYVGKSQGTVAGGRYTPTAYEEATDTGKRQSETVMAYSGGVPGVLTYTSPREAGPDSPNPATQGDALDPLTASFVLLQPRSENALCNMTVTLFDGRRRSHFALSPPQRNGDVITCTGEYRRLLGYLPDEIARHRSFPLTATFAPAGNGTWHATQIALQTIYGPATINRR